MQIALPSPAPTHPGLCCLQVTTNVVHIRLALDEENHEDVGATNPIYSHIRTLLLSLFVRASKDSLIDFGKISGV
jgi:hypothetical protein